MVTPGRRPPCASVTLPVTTAFATWAKAGTDRQRDARTVATMIGQAPRGVRKTLGSIIPSPETRLRRHTLIHRCGPRRASERELYADFDQSCAENLRRRQPRRTVACVDAENRTGVQHVVHIQLALNPRSTDLHILREPHVELIDAVFEHRLRLKDVRDRHRGSANAVIVLPDPMTRYCRPSSRYVMGAPPQTGYPVW